MSLTPSLQKMEKATNNASSVSFYTQKQNCTLVKPQTSPLAVYRSLRAAADKSGDWPHCACHSRRDRLLTWTKMSKYRKEPIYLAGLVALKRLQRAVSEFNVKDGDIATVAHSSTGQSITLLLLQRRHLATVPTTRMDALCRKPRSPVAFQWIFNDRSPMMKSLSSNQHQYRWKKKR